MPSMDVRRGGPENFAALAALDATSFATPHRVALLHARLAAADAWVAGAAGDLIGYALRGQFFGLDFLELLYVAPAHRRRGVAGALIEAFEEARRTAKLFVSTNRSNAGMRALLDRRGYAPSGVIHNLDPDDPELVFVRRYDGGPIESAS